MGSHYDGCRISTVCYIASCYPDSREPHRKSNEKEVRTRKKKYTYPEISSWRLAVVLMLSFVATGIGPCNIWSELLPITSPVV